MIISYYCIHDTMSHIFCSMHHLDNFIMIIHVCVKIFIFQFNSRMIDPTKCSLYYFLRSLKQPLSKKVMHGLSHCKLDFYV